MIRKWLGKIATGILIVLLVGILATTISAKMNNGAPKVFGKEIMTVLSGSMEPGIMTGSIIAVRPVPNPLQEHFKKGDVITFKAVDNNNMLITHRIVDIKGSGQNLQFVTRGDNNDAQDPSPVPIGNVVGQYANFTIPYLGYILSWMKTKVGIAVMLLVPGLYLIVQSLIGIFRALTKEDQKASDKSASSETPAEITPEATPSNG